MKLWIISNRCPQLKIETFSSYDNNAKEDVNLKINTYFQLEFREWLDVLTIFYGAAS